MGKKSGKKDREDRARRKLAEAQLAMFLAQEERARIVNRAEKEVEQARQRAARWVSKATERVERRAAGVAKEEGRLAALTTPRTPRTRHRSSLALRQAGSAVEPIPDSPEKTLPFLAHTESQPPFEVNGSGLILPRDIDPASRANGQERTIDEGDTGHRS